MFKTKLGGNWFRAEYTQLIFDFRSTKAFVVKRLEAEGAEVVFLFFSPESKLEPQTLSSSFRRHER